jgi:RNA polymerase sigma-70 factor (ECF subfamily)
MSYSIYTNEELLEKLKGENSSAASSEIYNRFFSVLFQFAIRMTKESMLAEDIVHDVFTKFYNNPPNVNIKLDAYLYQAVKYTFIDIINKTKSQAKYIQSLTTDAYDVSYSIDDQLIVKELEIRIYRAIENFPPKMKEIFLLSRKMEMNHKEIAAMLKIKEATVARQISNGIIRLYAKLLFLILFVKVIIIFQKNPILHKLFNYFIDSKNIF